MSRPVDDVDEQILALLRQDGRLPYAAIGREVGLSTPAVQRRVERLESTGVITGYTVQVDQRKLGHGLQAFIEVRFAGSATVESIWETSEAVGEIEAVYTIAGETDALIHAQVRDVSHLQDVLATLRRNQTVTGTRTRIVLGAHTRDGRQG